MLHRHIAFLSLIVALGACEVPAGPASQQLLVWDQPPAEQGQLFGQVAQVVTGVPVGDALVTLSSGTEARSASDGSFAAASPIGRVRVLVKRSGYLTSGRDIAMAGIRTEAIFRLMRMAPPQAVGPEGGTLSAGAVVLEAPQSAYPSGASVSVTYVPRDQVDVVAGPPQYTDETDTTRRIVGVVAIGSSTAPAMPLAMSAPVPAEATDQDVRLVSLDAEQGHWTDPTMPVGVADGQAVFVVPGDGTWGVAVDATVPDARNLGYIITQSGGASGLTPGQVVGGGTQVTAGDHSVMAVDPQGSTVEIGAGSTVILDPPQGETAGDAGAPADAGGPDLPGAHPVSPPTGSTVPHAGHLTLVKGWLKVSVPAPLPAQVGRYRMHVRTLLGLYSVKGTAFAITSCLAAGSVSETLEVVHGTVETRAESQAKDVSAPGGRTLCAGCAMGAAPVCPAGRENVVSDGGMTVSDGPARPLADAAPPLPVQPDAAPVVPGDGPPAPDAAPAPDAGVSPDAPPAPDAAPDGPAPPRPDAPPPPPPVLDGEPGALAFDPLSIGSSSGAQSFVVTNTGGSPSGALTVTVTGDFSRAGGDCQASLPSGARCTVTVRFEPTTDGTRQGLVTVTGSGGVSASATLSGTGLAPAMLTSAPRSLTFGRVNVGAASAPQSVTVTNTGGTPAAITTALQGGASGDFQLSSACGASLGAGATCTVMVRFVPTAGGARSASLVVTAMPGGAVSSALDGVGVAPTPLLRITPAPADFGTVTVGATSDNLDFQISNVGTGPSGPVSLTLTGANADQFVVQASTCKEVVLAPGDTCTAVVAFAPKVAGQASAVLQVQSTAGGAPTSALTGVATAPTLPPRLGFRPAALTLVSALQHASAPGSLTLVNVGEGPATNLTTVITGADAAMWSITGSTCGDLAPNATCTVSLSFRPTSAGAHDAVLTTSAGVVSASAKLAGNVPALDTKPQSDAFGSVLVGQSQTHQYTVISTGNVATGILTTATKGDYAVDPNKSTCQGALAPGATCSLVVTFMPAAFGARPGVVAISGPNGEAAQITLTGSGVLRTVPGPVPTPGPILGAGLAP